MRDDCSPEDVFGAVYAAGQGHVLRWWDELDEAAREGLLEQLGGVDFAQMEALAEDVRAGRFAKSSQGAASLPEYVALPRNAEDESVRERARRAGEEAIRDGKVAALTVAGGQGTRLGFDYPKGMFPIGPVSGKTLFQIHAERILATRRRYGGAVPWYIMTSDATDEPTRAYLEKEGWFGLRAEDVLCFKQGMLPALDREFNLVMTAKDRVLFSPNGHGGTLAALRDTGMLTDMEARGVEEISYFQVDNPLVPAVDPVFVGFHRLAGAQMSSKAMWKREPLEPIGAFVLVDGRLVVLEYSDLTPDEAGLRTGAGLLVHGLGSPAIHVMRVDFVREMTAAGGRLPFHLAQKSSPCLNDDGLLVAPKEKNVYKFETFIFDALPFTERTMILEMAREREFSPVKNPSGADSADSARADMVALCADWLEGAGVAVPRDAKNRSMHAIEVSPLFALDAGELAGRVRTDMEVAGPLYLAEGGGE